MRLFIAITVPQQLHRYCTQLQSQFHDLKMTREYHMTVQFLGNDIKNAQPIIEALKKVKFEPFEIKIGDAITFPDIFRPRGVWIECEESDALMNLAGQIRKEMEKAGYIADKPFKAHITLGRYKRPPHRTLKSIKGEPHTFTVDQFYLIDSTLTPDGPKYKTIARFPE